MHSLAFKKKFFECVQWVLQLVLIFFRKFLQPFIFFQKFLQLFSEENLQDYVDLDVDEPESVSGLPVSKMKLD